MKWKESIDFIKNRKKLKEKQESKELFHWFIRFKEQIMRSRKSNMLNEKSLKFKVKTLLMKSFIGLKKNYKMYSLGGKEEAV